MVSESMEQNPKPHNKWRKKRLSIAGVVLVLLGTALVWFFQVINSPSTGKGVVIASTNVSPATSHKLLTLTGKHFSFNYSDVFSRAPLDPPKAPILENYSLVKHQVNAWDLAIQIESLPSGNLYDDGSYHFRKVKTDIYSE